jgi:type I restriction enzyme, R subunit
MDETREMSPGYSTAPPIVSHLFNEETTVEEIIEHLQAPALGWTYRSREKLAEMRPDDREVLLVPVLRAKLKELNADILTDEERINAIITKLRACRDNQQWLAWLQNGVNYQFDPAETAKDVRLLAYDDLKLNDWCVRLGGRISCCSSMASRWW